MTTNKLPDSEMDDIIKEEMRKVMRESREWDKLPPLEMSHAEQRAALSSQARCIAVHAAVGFHWDSKMEYLFKMMEQVKKGGQNFEAELRKEPEFQA